MWLDKVRKLVKAVKTQHIRDTDSGVLPILSIQRHGPGGYKLYHYLPP